AVNVLVDTSVWSLALRRTRKQLAPPERALVFALHDLIQQGRAVLVGVVRQELLSGVREDRAFERLSDYLREFPDEPPTVDDYEDAARCDNLCRAAGVAATPVDMLICAVARRQGALVFTIDQDFQHYAAPLSLRLLEVR